MLQYLHIRGLALLDDVGLDFGSGMNVLTGETGAGKSIIVDALGLVRGARGRSELVREGADHAEVEAQFDLDVDAAGRLTPVLANQGFELEERAVVVGRRLARSGRGRTQLQSRLTTRSVLQEVGSRLVDICSQHEHHSLTDVTQHLDLLDEYAALGERVATYRAEFRAWQQACAELRRIREAASDRLRRADYLRFQIEELEAAEEDLTRADALRERLTLLRGAHRWASFAAEARYLLYEGDDAMAPRLAGLADTARRGPDSVGSLVEIAEQLEAAQIACEEAARAAEHLSAELEMEPGELDAVEERVHELDRLERKHGCGVDELAQRLEQMRRELDELEGAESRLQEVQAVESEHAERCRKLARALRKERSAAARRLAEAVEAELVALHIPNARLAVELRPLPEGELGPNGMDRAEFMFSANAGEPLAPLNRVASGGELSRVLLAVKGVLATGDRVVTYVFDEVDAGVGGAVAEAIGRRLARTAQSRQVMCITHLPQIAAFADSHFHVEKHTEGGRTVTRVRRLEGDERIEELARMLAGAEVSQSARAHAAQLIAEARSWLDRDNRGRAAGKARSAAKAAEARASAVPTGSGAGAKKATRSTKGAGGESANDRNSSRDAREVGRGGKGRARSAPRAAAKSSGPTGSRRSGRARSGATSAG